ncbi:MAG TPA: ABC transporter permease, partial [Inquilinus sp.]
MSTSSIPSTASSGRAFLLRVAELRAWLFLILLVVFFEAWARIVYDTTFILNPYNLQSIGVFAVAPLLLALGQTFIIISAGIDLSVGFTMGLASVVAAHAANLGPVIGLGPVPAMLLGLLAGVAVAFVPGLVNGWLIAHLKVPPFIGTLGMYGVARGAAFLIAGGTTVPVVNSWFATIGNGRVAGIPTVVLITVIAALAMHYLLSQTRFGQHTYAIGANRNAALRAGIDVRRHAIRLYLLAAVCAGLAGSLYAARFNAGAAQAGEPLLLD